MACEIVVVEGKFVVVEAASVRECNRSKVRFVSGLVVYYIYRKWYGRRFESRYGSGFGGNQGKSTDGGQGEGLALWVRARVRTRVWVGQRRRSELGFVLGFGYLEAWIGRRQIFRRGE